MAEPRVAEHPYWRAFASEPGHVVIETGALDRNAPGPMNYIGYWLIPAGQLEVWQRYLEYILSDLRAKGVAQSWAASLYSEIKGKWRDPIHDRAYIEPHLVKHLPASCTN